jgi:hypothetical protein
MTNRYSLRLNKLACVATATTDGFTNGDRGPVIALARETKRLRPRFRKRSSALPNLNQVIGDWMTDMLPDSPSADRQPVDVLSNLMKMALALLDREEQGGSVSACLLQEAIEARSTR